MYVFDRSIIKNFDCFHKIYIKHTCFICFFLEIFEICMNTEFEKFVYNV